MDNATSKKPVVQEGVLIALSNEQSFNRYFEKIERRIPAPVSKTERIEIARGIGAFTRPDSIVAGIKKQRDQVEAGKAPALPKVENETTLISAATAKRSGVNEQVEKEFASEMEELDKSGGFNAAIKQLVIGLLTMEQNDQGDVLSCAREWCKLALDEDVLWSRFETRPIDGLDDAKHLIPRIHQTSIEDENVRNALQVTPLPAASAVAVPDPQIPRSMKGPRQR